jgi:hypothetical protein
VSGAMALPLRNNETSDIVREEGEGASRIATRRNYGEVELFKWDRQ